MSTEEKTARTIDNVTAWFLILLLPLTLAFVLLAEPITPKAYRMVVFALFYVTYFSVWIALRRTLTKTRSASVNAQQSPLSD